MFNHRFGGLTCSRERGIFIGTIVRERGIVITSWRAIGLPEAAKKTQKKATSRNILCIVLDFFTILSRSSKFEKEKMGYRMSSPSPLFSWKIAPVN
jgi:hypothetical protein